MKILGKKEWLPLIGMTVAAFIFNTSEFIPIGLLSSIADSFSISEADAGMLITAYSWTVMLLSLPLMVWASRINFRNLFLGVVCTFTVFQILSVISANFWILLICRLGVACTHAIFWSIASPVAVKLVNKDHESMALSMIITGTSIAMILGLPLGRVIGLAIGWRMTFAVVAMISACICIYMFFVFPKFDKGEPFSLSGFPKIFRNKALIGVYVVTFLFATAYYTAYSYIDPFLSQVAHVSDSVATVVLMVFGGAGILGSILFSKTHDSHRIGFLTCSIAGISVCVALLQFASVSVPTIFLVCAVWGLSATSFNVAFQSEVITAADDSISTVAMALFSSIFNLGIGLGTYIGGITVTNLSIAWIGYVGAVFGVLALLYFLLKMKSVLH